MASASLTRARLDLLEHEEERLRHLALATAKALAAEKRRLRLLEAHRHAAIRAARALEPCHQTEYVRAALGAKL